MRRFLPHPVTALLVLVLAGVGALAWWSTTGSDAFPARTAASQTRTEQALAAAQRTAINSASYNYQSLATQFATVESELTGPALTDFNNQKADLQTAVNAQKLVATATVLDAAVIPGPPTGSNEVLTMIALNVNYVRSGGTPVPGSELLQVDMINNGKGWLAQNIKPIIASAS
jgi:hypothetical protein